MPAPIIKPIIDRTAGPDYPAGFDAPALDVDAADPDLTGSDAAGFSSDHGAIASLATKGVVSKAFAAAPNDWGWRHQDRQEIGAYRETLAVVAPDDSGNVLVVPDLCSIWDITSAGDLTITLNPPLDDYDPPDASAPAAQYAASVVLIVQRPGASTITFAGTVLLPASVRALSGTANDPFGQNTASGTIVEVFTAVYTAARGWIVFVAGTGIS